MEIYLVNVVDDLIVTALLVGVVFAYGREAHGQLGMRIVVAGLGVGFVAAIVMAFMKQNTSRISTGDWNMGIFTVSLVAAVVALVFTIVMAAIRKKGKPNDGEKGSGAARTLSLVVLMALVAFMALRVFYRVPDVINYPATISTASAEIISSDFIYRFVGWLLGIVIVVAACVATSKAFKALSRRMLGLSTGVIVGIVCVMQTVSLLQIFLARRIIKAGTDLYKAVFSVTSWMSGNTLLFTLVIPAIVAALAIVVIVLSLRDNEPYDNPAEHRKIKAKWRNRRRWAIFLIVCLVVSLVTITAVKDYANRGPELSPSEECEVSDGNVYVALEQVEDGHLHRFTYVTEAGVPLINTNNKESSGGVGVRFIVIKKPGSSAYGIGLDACEICGQTGYYERDGQVVCKLCDVVMNINTIGFKGGCNPIPVKYMIKDGYIVFETRELAQYEKIFK